LRRSLTLAALALLLAACDRDPRWNVVLISVDTLRADHVGCYGYRNGSTPSIDRLAADGLRFEHCYTPVPVTLPAHTTMLSGMIPPRHSVRDNSTFAVPGDLPTLATRLQAEGFTTLGVIGAFPLASRFGLNRGFGVWDEELGDRYRKLIPLFFDQRKADQVTRRAQELLRRHTRERFFLFVHYYDPHHPWDPPEPYSLTFRALPYDGEIAFADRWVGELLATLRELRLWDNTLVVLTADHGEGLGEHGEMTHSMQIYDTTQRVPLILRYPGVRAGVVERPVSLTDIAPTVLKLLGLEPGADLDGVSLVGPPPGERLIYLETLVGRLLGGWNDLRGCVAWPHKYIRGPEPRLFDLASDPREQRNLAALHPEVVRELDRRLLSLIGERSREYRLADRFRIPDLEVKARLVALGYLSPTTPADGLEELGPVRPGQDPGQHLPSVETLSLVRERLASGDFRAAIALLEGALVHDPDNCEILRNLAGAHVLCGDFQRAEAVAGRLLELTQSDGIAFALAASAQRGLGDLDRALELVDRALALEPEVMTFTLKARILSDRGDLAGMAAVVEEGLAVIPCERDLLVELANLCRRHEDRACAGSAYLRMLDCDARDPMPLYNLGTMALENGDLVGAVGRFKDAVEADPTYAAAHYGLALAHLEAGEREAAEVEAREALRLSDADQPFGRQAAALLTELEGSGDGR